MYCDLLYGLGDCSFAVAFGMPYMPKSHATQIRGWPLEWTFGKATEEWIIYCMGV